MARWSLRRGLTVWALGLVAAAIAAVAGVSYSMVVRLSREEAMARVERAAERGLGALGRGLDPGIFEAGTGVELVMRSRAEIRGAFDDPRVPLWREALEGGRAARLLGSEVGAVAVRALPGEPPPGVLEARIPAAAVEAPVRRFAARVLAASAAVALAAALTAALAARRMGRPLAELARAAERLGAGDLGRPIPAPGGTEAAALGATLERARVRLGEAGAEVERRRGELESVVTGIAEGVVAVDRDRRVTFLSAPAAALVGVEPAAAIGRFCGDLLLPRQVDGARPCDDACPILHARFRGTSRAVEMLEAAGAPARPVVVSASPPADGLQVLILREETQVEAARRARDSAVADLAHELQTPLAAQGASLELLRERLAESDPEGLDLVLALEAGTARLRRLIDNLLESVRIESGQLGIRRVEVDLEEVFEEAVAMTRSLAGRRRQRLELELAHPPPTLTGDPQRLGQLLVNLLSNASKFGPEGSTVRLGAVENGDRVGIWVEDEGPGFAEPAPRASARFRRGPFEPRQEGSGLGLWICRSILERHGGSLVVTREAGRTRVIADLPKRSAT